MSDHLLHRVANGDASAVKECIQRYGGLVWSLARRFSRSQSEAEDAAQDVFVDLWRSAHRYDVTVASEIAFVAMIARRRLIDRQRRASRQLTTETLDDAPTATRGSERIEACSEAMLAAKVLDQIQPEQRQVLVLAACHGMSHREIADSMGLPLGTVKTHARRGLLRVREMLGASIQLGVQP